MTGIDPSRPVVLSFGMGVDSTALLVRWLLDPPCRGFDLDRLVVVTAMTGDEYAATGSLMTQYVLPMLRGFQVRYVQLSRAGQSSRAGYVVLDDSRQPSVMRMRGPWRLSDELRATATVPQVAHGRRLCSIRAKAEPADAWIADNVGADYTHVLGFGVHEQSRITRDRSYTRHARRPAYPLAAWGWDRERASGFLFDVFGVRWQRSCCTYCPFATLGSGELGARWRSEPAAAADALELEYTAMACNPRSMLFARRTVPDVLAGLGMQDVVDRAAVVRERSGWCVYEVRRIFHARRSDPGCKGPAWRSLRRLAVGDHDTMRAHLAEGARLLGAVVEVDRFGIHRAWLSRAGAMFPTTEHLLVLAPATAVDKQRPGFDRLWRSLATEQQLALFPTDPA